MSDRPQGVDYDASGIPAVYNEARALGPDSARLWAESIRRLVPPGPRRRVLDVGCGTGRFAPLLVELVGPCCVVGVEPSLAMLRERDRALPASARFVAGRAEALPVRGGSVDLAFLSMVYHHFSPAEAAVAELARVLAPGGCVVLRAATREILDDYVYLTFFPESRELDRRRMPSRDGLRAGFAAHGLNPAGHEVVRQPFAANYSEYFKKVSLRALSSLRMIPDDAFARGLPAFERHCRDSERGEPVYEPVELFVFVSGGS